MGNGHIKSAQIGVLRQKCGQTCDMLKRKQVVPGVSDSVAQKFLRKILSGERMADWPADQSEAPQYRGLNGRRELSEKTHIIFKQEPDISDLIQT